MKVAAKCLLTIVFISIFNFSNAEDLSGCLSAPSSGKRKFLLDPNCECLKTNSCIKFKPFKYSDNFYDSKDKDGKNVFLNDEKAKMKETYELFNRIMDLKSKGFGNSDEIKELYVKLDKVNKEVRFKFLKNHPESFENFKTSYKKNYNESMIRQEKNAQKVASALKIDRPNNNVKQLDVVEKSLANDAAKADDNKNAKNVDYNKSGNKENYKMAVQKEEPAQFENDNILKNLKNQKLDRNDDDSLFDIITKSYKRSYRTLLSP